MTRGGAAAIDRLLDLLLSSAHPSSSGADTSGQWLAVSRCGSRLPAAAARHLRRHGPQGGLVLLRSHGKGGEIVNGSPCNLSQLQSQAPLAELLRDLPRPVDLLFLDLSGLSKRDLRWRALRQQPERRPAVLLLSTTARCWPWQRRPRQLLRRLQRQGYSLLNEEGGEWLLWDQRRSAAGQALLPAAQSPGQQHPEPPALRIRSFDVWDTLITRWHPDPKVVFDLVGERAGIANYRELRVAAEREARRRQPAYTLDTIYDTLVDLGSINIAQRDALLQLELAMEAECVRPIQANLDQLQAGDVLISDMYLSAAQMRQLVRPFADLDRHPFLVSASGKQRGQVWRALKQAGIQARHLGDNYMADYVRAAKRDHHAALVRESSYSALECRFADAGLVALANLMRLQRLELGAAELRQGQPASEQAGLLTVQRRFNLPLLYLTALELLQRAQGPEPPTHLLFCARDCSYLHGFYQAMARATQTQSLGTGSQSGSQTLPHDHYFLTSRKAKARASGGYRAYCRSLLGDHSNPRPLLIDLQGSGRSSAVFFREQLELEVQQLFVYTGEDNLRLHRAESLLERPLVRRLLPRACDLLEVLSYGPDHSLLDMHRLGELGFIPEFEPEQRSAKLLQLCHSFEAFFLQTKQLMASSAFQHLFRQHDLQHYQRSHFALLEEIDGLEDLRLLRELCLRFHRKH